MAAVTVAALSRWELDALNVRHVTLDSEVTRLHSEIDDDKELRAEVIRLGRDAER